MTRLFRIFLMFALLVFGSHAQAAGAIEGVVRNAALDGALAGVTIAIKTRGNWRDVPGRTGLDGAFSFDPGALLPSDERADRFLTVRFEKEGFWAWLQKVRTGPEGVFSWKGDVRLNPKQGAAALSDSERAQLDRFRSSEGRTLFLIPYELITLGASPGQPSPDQINTLLSFNLRRGIFEYLQRMQVSLAEKGISLQSLPLQVSPNNSERLVAYGHYLKALGVVGGLGTLVSQSDSALVNVSSVYHIIPSIEGLTVNAVAVDDHLRQDKLMSMELYREFNNLWGRATVIAIAVRTFQAARAAGDSAALAEVEKLLLKERKSVGPGRMEFETELNSLVAAVQKEIARLGGHGGGSR